MAFGGVHFERVVDIKYQEQIQTHHQQIQAICYLSRKKKVHLIEVVR